jgi:formylglycine-generating enzyme
VSCCELPGRGEIGLTERPPGRTVGLPEAVRARLVRIPGGEVEVGTDVPELPADGEAPRRRARLRPFLIDPYAVTNGWFTEFIRATGYVTEAQRFGWSFVFVGLLPAEFPPTQAVAAARWWRKVDGASWRTPAGPASSLEGREDHPVVHVSWNDARAFAAWAGGRLPSEAEWEHAARGGLTRARFPWGEREPDDTEFLPCNIWQGHFPEQNSMADGFVGTAPVGSFPGNGYGLHDMAGNVWEWCQDPFRVRSLRKLSRAKDEGMAAGSAKVLKGGSYLCHRSYCYRYRIAARLGNPPDTSTGHVGIRLAFDLA